MLSAANDLRGMFRELFGCEGFGDNNSGVTWDLIDGDHVLTFRARCEATDELFKLPIDVHSLVYGSWSMRTVYAIIWPTVERFKARQCLECGEDIHVNKQYPRRLFCYSHKPPPWSMYYGWNPPYAHKKAAT